MSNCQPSTACPGQEGSKMSKEECKVGCRQMFDGTHDNGPRMDAQQVLDEVNKIRKQNGVGPMTYNYDGQACADKAAAYNALHGAHKCGIDGVCSNCGWRAAGDCYANDRVDAVDRMYESRFHEGPKADICDETSHCGALLIYNQIAVGYDEAGAYATLYYWD